MYIHTSCINSPLTIVQVYIHNTNVYQAQVYKPSALYWGKENPNVRANTVSIDTCILTVYI